MKIAREKLHDGYKPPLLYGYSYEDWLNGYVVMHIIPFNIVARFLHNTYRWMRSNGYAPQKDRESRDRERTEHEARNPIDPHRFIKSLGFNESKERQILECLDSTYREEKT